MRKTNGCHGKHCTQSLHPLPRAIMDAMNKRLLVLTALVGVAALSRLAPHPDNVTPVAAIALFGGACFAGRRAAYGIPLLAMVIGDVALCLAGRYGWLESLQTQVWVYACLLLTVWIGRSLPAKRNFLHIGAASLAGSLLFFAVTNFACWAFGTLYTKDGAGLAQCFTAAVPFFRASLAGDLCFAAVLFGGFALLEKGFPALRQEQAPVAA